MTEITTPFTQEQADRLRVGDSVLFTGTLFTARDAAHARLCQALEAGDPLPFDPRDAVVYYVGPTPARPGHVIGSAGPTTSYRMDAYSRRCSGRACAAWWARGCAARPSWRPCAATTPSISARWAAPAL